MDHIYMEYDQEIESYLVSFPREVLLNALETWGSDFMQELCERSDQVGLLVDTNTHNFESIACLKWLKNFLTEEPVVTIGINRVAFVQPVQYRMPEVVTESEAYFSTCKEAYEWLLIR
jgi:hypothetical protein